MAGGNGLTIEVVNAEVERLGSVIRSLSTQLAGMRSRVSDLEYWDVSLLAKGKDTKKKRRRGKLPKKKGKGKGKEKGKGKGGNGKGGYRPR